MALYVTPYAAYMLVISALKLTMGRKGNCKPRLPAVQHQVRRDTPNKGRWFYTCQLQPPKGERGKPENCGFFLWAEDARLREEGAVLNNSTTEPGGSTQVDRNGAGKKTPMKSPKKLIQTTLSARVEPREEGKRHWTHRTEITPIGELERSVNGSQKEGRGKESTERPEGGGDANGATKSGATLQTANTTASDSKTVAGTRTEGDNFGTSDLDTDDEDELGRILDTVSRSTSGAAETRQEQLQTPSAGSKRKRDVIEADDDDDDDLFGDMDSEEERQLAAITDFSAEANRSRDAFVTPAAKRSADVVAGMPTPSLTEKPVRRVLFAEDVAGPSSNKRQRSDLAGAYVFVGGPTTPSSSQEAAGPSSSPKTPGSGSSIEDITEKVMGLLQGQKIDEQILREVKNTLETYTAKVRGVEKGREASRQAAKSKDGIIAQLQLRIANLENRRKLDLETRKKWKHGLLDLYTQT